MTWYKQDTLVDSARKSPCISFGWIANLLFGSLKPEDHNCLAHLGLVHDNCSHDPEALHSFAGFFGVGHVFRRSAHDRYEASDGLERLNGVARSPRLFEGSARSWDAWSKVHTAIRDGGRGRKAIGDIAYGTCRRKSIFSSAK